MTESKLAELGARVAAHEDALPPPAPSEQTRRLLAERAAARLRPPRVARRAFPLWARLSLAALLSVGLFVLSEAVSWRQPLSFTVGTAGQAGLLMAWESAPPDAQLPIRFSDGTYVELEPNARARVVAVGRAGAELVIESGRAHLAVVPARLRLPGESAWRVNLGPFEVEVKGTRFDVQWDPHAGELALDLLEGKVTVSGCESGQAHTLVAGQGLRASCRERGWTVLALSELAQREAPATAVAEELSPTAAVQEHVSQAFVEEAPPAVKAAPKPPPRPRRGAAAPSTSQPGWQQLARDGHYQAAYAAALAAGFERVSARASAGELVLLGDTARLQGDVERARQAYGSARERFAGSTAAGNAAFALGRLAVESDPGEARRWFEQYLREQPRGAFAAPADDWLFELAARAGDAERMRDVASSYLRRRPAGAHAADARRILDAPP